MTVILLTVGVIALIIGAMAPGWIYRDRADQMRPVQRRLTRGAYLAIGPLLIVAALIETSLFS